ncbi:MAG: class I SAM-dependent methyltransferase [Burkholderiales bacterium]|nr:class I SAM-dependent methyltransferase [Burkholderiales bacterium]MCA3230656.1 class I SAM-dependent methyltransferase [Burkholderiales bacterium]
MPDLAFSDPRLASLYDALEGDRPDLDFYAALVERYRARRVLDVGCGTGTFACLLARRGLDVIGLDPAGASLQVARHKAGADRVRWIEGEPAALPPLDADLATLTGNVAQVFLEDAAWIQALRGIRGALAADGLLVFETRDPARAAWLRWTPQRTARTIQAPGAGTLRTWCQVTQVDGPFVDFRWTFEFEADGARLVSSSRLRFRGRSEIEASLACSGFLVVDVLDAPDRPGEGWVFVARARGAAVSPLSDRCLTGV